MGLKIKSIWDNGGETIDRITVVLDCYGGYNKDLMCLSVNLNTNSPQGFSQFGNCVEGDHLGKKIELKDLSPELQDHIARRLK